MIPAQQFALPLIDPLEPRILPQDGHVWFTLNRITDAFRTNPALGNLMLDPFFKDLLNRTQQNWREVVALAVSNGIPVPAFSASLAYYDSYRTERLPANLLQAQRDFFGAHTYERIDTPRGQFFHTNWTGRGGRVSSGSYNA